MAPLSRKGKGGPHVLEPHKRTQPFSKGWKGLGNELPGERSMGVFRAILFAALVVATPLCAGAQIGDGQGELPGGPWTPPPARPSGPPPACQQLWHCATRPRSTAPPSRRPTSAKQPSRMPASSSE